MNHKAITAINFISALKLSQISKEVFYLGINELDSLIGGIEKGKFYLFYGNPLFLRHFIHRILVKFSIEGKIAYINNTNYYSSKNFIDFDILALYSKMEGYEITNLARDVYFVAAYNELRQPKSVEELLKHIAEEKIEVVIFDGINKFLDSALNRKVAFENLKLSFYKILRFCIERNISLIVTLEYEDLEPRLPHFVLHFSHVAVFFRIKGSRVQACLIKHYAKDTNYKTSIINFQFQEMGRITIPFREKYQAMLNSLQENLLPLIRDVEYKESFEQLIKEVWDYEYAAMANSGLPLVIDNLNLMANLHNKSKINLLKKMIEEKDQKIRELEKRIVKLEEKLKELTNGHL